MRPAAWVFVGDLDELGLDDSDAHHLGRVLRLRPGEAVGASDGRGRWRACVVADAAGGVLRLHATSPVVADSVPHPPITVGFSLVKGDRPELVVQKLTELGVDRIVLFAASRSVVVWEGERAVHHLARLRRVAREAAVQSRRARLPEVSDLASLASLLEEPGAVVADPSGGPPSLAMPTIVVGPEGGFSTEERRLARGSVRLGSNVLRAETAAMVAGALLVALREGIAGPVGGAP